VTLEAVSV